MRLLLLLALIGIASNSLFGGEPVHLTILYTNDVHARLLPDKEGRGGWANIAAYFKTVKSKVEADGGAVLILDGGDMIQGTVVSSVFQGEPIFEGMNAAGYDAAVLGNHEFDLGLEQTAKFLQIADFPLLAANIQRAGEPVGDAETLLLPAGKLKIGLIGLATSQWVYQDALDFEHPAAAVSRHIKELKKKADLVIALSHLGLDRDQELAKETDGLDLILGAHTHTLMESAKEIEGVLIVQAGAFGHYVGRLDLKIDPENNGILDYKWNLIAIPVNDLPADTATQERIDFWEGKLASEMNIVIGESQRFLRRDIELRSMVGQVWKEAYQTDFGWQNPGANMQDLPAGPIEVRDFYEIMPWGNTLVILDMIQEQIGEILKKNQFMREKSTYTLITNSFAARELAERFNLPKDSLHPIPVQARDPVIAFVRKNGRLPELNH